MSKPITPQEQAAQATTQIPDVVFDCVNAVLCAGGTHGRIVVHQDSIVTELTGKHGLDLAAIYDKNWLDFEPAYREAGWRVTYDKPGYNEDYRAHWVFTRK